ncbi:ABC transporter permease [Pseudoalteromonas luteoviolacea]|uniref:ABC transporter permease n=1 Tax=Pseudoalteromonas luteoviolacea TaxID=43657 RepID=UPI001B38F555|nr:ABC transporter permease [Pseudoalteromonas luteoviolacea]MBQ4837112.1 ABC transporter permease [Pseudoalteromonas luteoviolacea]
MMNIPLYSLRQEAWCDLKNVFRSLGFVIPVLAFPCAFYLFFGVTMGDPTTSSYLLINYIIFGVIGPALFNFGVNVATERENGLLTLKQLSPMPASQYLLGKTFTAIVFSSLIFVLLSCLAVVLAGVNMAFQQWMLLYFLAVFSTIPFCMLGLCMGLSFSAKTAPALVNLVYLPISMLSGLWLPIALFPEVLQLLAWLLPNYHLSQLGLSILSLHQGFELSWHVIGVMAFTLPCAWLATKKYNSLQ